jgi:hypothetical protein
MKNFVFEFLNWLIDFFFLLDIIVNFRTTFMNSKTGEEEFDPKEIRWNYLKSRFWIDFLATVPFDKIF